MIKTWIANISPLLSEEKYQYYYQRASAIRQEKADGLKNPLNKAQSIGVWALWSKIKEDFSFHDDYLYNFSHSGFYVLCTVDTSKPKEENAESETAPLLGGDIEKLGEFKPNFVKRFFTVGEAEEILSLQEEAQQIDLFYRYWVLKESYVKASRKGLTLDTKSFELMPQKPGERVTLLNQPEDFRRDFYLYELTLGELPYKAAICTTSAQVDLEVKEYSL